MSLRYSSVWWLWSGTSKGLKIQLIIWWHHFYLLHSQQFFFTLHAVKVFLPSFPTVCKLLYDFLPLLAQFTSVFDGFDLVLCKFNLCNVQITITLTNRRKPKSVHSIIKPDVGRQRNNFEK